jgi:YihY family inner membrane protein
MARRPAPGARTLGDLVIGAALALTVARHRARHDTGTAPVSVPAGPPVVAPAAPAPPTSGVGRLVARVQARADALQRRHGPLAFTYAVAKKFGDDRAGRLAALIAYYSFFSIFPLLLVLVTVLRFVLEGHAELRHDILDSALSQIPVVGQELGDTGVTGSWWALVTGVLGALWAGMGALLASQDAFNTVWNVPVTERPNFLENRLRGLLLLGVVGSALLVTTAAQSAIPALGVPAAGRLGLPLVVLLLDIGVLALVYRVLTDLPLSWRDVLPGAAVAGTGYWVVQLLGTWYFERVVHGASETYGTFAVVIGLLSWFYLVAQIALVGAEVAVVASRGWWPRGLGDRHPTVADQAVSEAIATSRVKPVVVAERARA